MTAIAPPIAPLPPTVASPTTGAATATSAPLGATALPTSGGSQDAMLGALKQLVTVLNALVEALKGAAQANGGGPLTKGGGPESKGGGPESKGGGPSPVQSPIQVPMQTAGVPSAAPIQGGGTATTLQPVAAGFGGPTVAAEPGIEGLDSLVFSSGANSFSQLGGSASVQFLERRPGTSTPVSVSVAAPGGMTAHVAVPASGSVALSSGATVSWTNGVELGFSIARAGQQPLTFDSASADRVPGFGDKVASPLDGAEIAELARALAARYPAVT